MNYVADDYIGVAHQAFTVRRGFGWLPGPDIGVKVRPTSDPLTNDFVFGRSGRFQVAVPDGHYEVHFTLGDALTRTVRDRINLWIEGVQVATDLQSANGEFLTPTYQAEVADGRLTIRIRDGGGVNPYFALNALDITPTDPGATSPGYHFDFGRIVNYVAKDHVGVATQENTSTSTFGWVSAEGLSVVARSTPNPLTRDFVAGRDQTFEVAIENGTYDVCVTLGDPSSVRDRMDLWVGGNQVAAGVRTMAGQFRALTYRTEVTDGVLTVRIRDDGGSNLKFALNALDIVPAAEGSAPSPTGGTPNLLWTGEQQAIWNRMRAENHPWWQLIKNNADHTGTAQEQYGDVGQWASLAFQITGDPTYAAKAWAKLAALPSVPASRNDSREYLAEYVIMYNWIRPALTPAQRTQFVNLVNGWGDYVLGHMSNPYLGGTRTTDSDECIGHYFGLAMIDLGTQEDNPRAGTFLTNTFPDSTGVKPVGGFTSTGANFATMRNAISKFIQLAEGGEWIESSDYNLGTLKLLLMGAEAVRTATGQDYFPEVTRLERQLALAQLRQLTPDLKAANQWGDEEHPRALQLWKRVALLGMLGGLTKNDPGVGPYINKLVAEFVEKYGATGYGSAEPASRIFYFYDPYAPQADWRPVLSPGSFNSGVGMMTYHAGWQADDSMFVGHMPNRLGIDHDVTYFGDFQLYRNGEWAVTHPLGYGNVAASGEGTNSLLVAGLSSMYQRGPVAAEIGSGYAYMAGTTSGGAYADGYWNPPPAFLKEWTRSQLYLPGSNGAADAIVVYDRVDMKDPKALPNYDRYEPIDRALIDAAPALIQWVVHTPEAPSRTPDGFEWNTAGGQSVRLFALSADQQASTVYNETALWGADYQFIPSELHYEVRLSPAAPQEWETLVNVVTAGDGVQAERVASSRGEAEGTLVRRAGMADTLALFGAVRGDRILTSGYTVAWAAQAQSTTVLLADLDPTASWSVRVDGVSQGALSVSAEGVAHLTVPGAGNHAIELVAR